MERLERSCGAVMYTRKDGEIRFVIVQEQAGAYSFPKGHMEGDETEWQTAQREVYEEIGVHPVFEDGFCEVDEYDLAEKPGTRKRVTYFLAQCTDEALAPREGEIRRIRLLGCEEAMECFEHQGTRDVLMRAYLHLTR